MTTSVAGLSRNRNFLRFWFGRVYLVGELVSVCGPALVATATGSAVFAATLVTAGFFLRHSGSALGNAASMSLHQMVTPTEMIGRMNAGMRMVMRGPQTVGAVAAGAIGGLIGVRGGLWVAAVGTLISVLPITFSRIPRIPDLSSAAVTVAPRTRYALQTPIHEQGELHANA